MKDISLDATCQSFLFREPNGFFDQFEKKDEISEALLQPLLAFRANLHSAVSVGVIPFQLVQRGVLDQRFNQLVIAAKIRNARTKGAPETEHEKDEQEFRLEARLSK
jgi:hypothetical protein